MIIAGIREVWYILCLLYTSRYITTSIGTVINNQGFFIELGIEVAGEFIQAVQMCIRDSH